jgi:oxygen-independent coproporphyrinogen-3 oxidase
VQDFEDTRALVAEARRLGFGSINADLIYGLPLQTPERYARTIEQLLEIRPDRVAVYSYAHMPWIKPHQRRIHDEDLPGPDEKLAIFATAIEGLRSAGYVAIGMDHFALPEDELGRALADGTLWRNFMGYTVRHAPEFLGLGLSAIGDVDGVFVQNERKLNRYEDAVAAGRLPIERGVTLSEDDRVRRYVITALMCTFHLDLDEVGQRFGIDARARFAPEWQALEELEADGFVRRRDGRLEVLEPGRLFVRTVCMVFDAYLDQPAAAGRPRFSRTV